MRAQKGDSQGQLLSDLQAENERAMQRVAQLDSVKAELSSKEEELMKLVQSKEKLVGMVKALQGVLYKQELE